jgi:hypothetical protein
LTVEKPPCGDPVHDAMIRRHSEGHARPDADVSGRHAKPPAARNAASANDCALQRVVNQTNQSTPNMPMFEKAAFRASSLPDSRRTTSPIMAQARR